jgi:hypothetical protein
MRSGSGSVWMHPGAPMNPAGYLVFFRAQSAASATAPTC